VYITRTVFLKFLTALGFAGIITGRLNRTANAGSKKNKQRYLSNKKMSSIARRLGREAKDSIHY